MTTPLITIQIQDGAVTTRLAELGAKVGNLQPFLGTLGEDMRQRTLARFSAGKGPDGVAWAPNAPATAVPLRQRVSLHVDKVRQ